VGNTKNLLFLFNFARLEGAGGSFTVLMFLVKSYLKVPTLLFLNLKLG